MDWSPQQYLGFAGERSRPARDLLAQVPLNKPRLVYDLGCGPGNSTAILAQRFPEAEIIGVDNSASMLAEARRTLPGREFAAGDLANWMPERNADLLFSNAAFHWVPDHLSLMVRFVQTLPSGGVLAVQMPDNLEEPSHRLMRETAENGPWAEKLAAAPMVRTAPSLPQACYDCLSPHCTRVDIWHTIYNHPLGGAEGIFEWVKSTGLRPFLAPLDEAERVAFLAAYLTRVAKAYPEGSDGKVLLRFPRLFIVAIRA